jgi:hypothetical protein
MISVSWLAFAENANDVDRRTGLSQGQWSNASHRMSPAMKGHQASLELEMSREKQTAKHVTCTRLPRPGVAIFSISQSIATLNIYIMYERGSNEGYMMLFICGVKALCWCAGATDAIRSTY